MRIWYFFRRRYLQEEDDLKIFARQREDALYAKLRSVRLNEYVAIVRKNLHEQRAIDKRDRKVAAVQKLREQKQKLMDARLKALAGEQEAAQKTKK